MNPTKHISYRGNHTASYDPQTGVGTVGKVMGVGALWFRVVRADYHPDIDRTRLTLERLINPQDALRATQEDQ